MTNETRAPLSDKEIAKQARQLRDKGIVKLRLRSIRRVEDETSSVSVSGCRIIMRFRVTGKRSLKNLEYWFNRLGCQAEVIPQEREEWRDSMVFDIIGSPEAFDTLANLDQCKDYWFCTTASVVWQGRGTGDDSRLLAKRFAQQRAKAKEASSLPIGDRGVMADAKKLPEWDRKGWEQTQADEKLAENEKLASWKFLFSMLFNG